MGDYKVNVVKLSPNDVATYEIKYKGITVITIPKYVGNSETFAKKLAANLNKEKYVVKI